MRHPVDVPGSSSHTDLMTAPKINPSASDINIPNALSFARLLMTPIVVWSMLREEHLLSLILLLLAALTDIMDGLWARSFHETTTLGTVLDPLADKAFFFGVFLTMGWGLGQFPLWFMYAVVGRDVVLVAGYLILKLMRRPIHVEPTVWGKLYTAVLFVIVAARLVGLHFEITIPFENYGLYGAMGLLFISFLDYLREFVRRSF